VGYPTFQQAGSTSSGGHATPGLGGGYAAPAGVRVGPGGLAADDKMLNAQKVLDALQAPMPQLGEGRVVEGAGAISCRPPVI